MAPASQCGLGSIPEQCHMWGEFVVVGFPPSAKTKISKLQFDQNRGPVSRDMGHKPAFPGFSYCTETSFKISKDKSVKSSTCVLVVTCGKYSTAQ